MLELEESAANHDAFVRRYLKLDPEVVALVEPGGYEPEDDLTLNASGRGLHYVLMRAMSTFLKMKLGRTALIRLENEDTAREKGFPDATTANFCLALTWGLTYHDRLMKSRPQFACAAAHPGMSGSLEACALLQESGEPFLAEDVVQSVLGPNIPGPKWAPPPLSETVGLTDGAILVPGSRIVEEVLGLDPVILARSCGRTFDDRGPFYRPDYEDAVHAGLCKLMRASLSQYVLIRARRSIELRLMTEDDARQFRGVDEHTANFGVMLAAGICGTTFADFEVHPARKPTPEWTAFLRHLGTWAREEGSLHAEEVVSLVCDDGLHVHAGPGDPRPNRLRDALRSGSEGRAT